MSSTGSARGCRAFFSLTLVLASLSLALLSPRPAIAQEPSPQHFLPAERTSPARSFRGFLAVRGQTVIAAENEGLLFVPASVLKLVVTAAALHYLGPEHRRRTSVHTAGSQQGAELVGDLVVRGDADPTWGESFHETDPAAPLHILARELRATGVRRIRGDLVLDVSRFPGPPQPASRPLSESGLWYGAPVSGIAFNENWMLLPIAPGDAVGAPGRSPGRLGPFLLENRILTVGPDRHGHGSVTFFPDPVQGRLTVWGDYPISEPAYEVKAAVPNPELHAGHALRAALTEEGIVLDGTVRVSRLPVPVSESPLAAIQSPPLKEWLKPILTDSHNWLAEMLLIILAEETRGDGRRDLGLDVEREFLEQVVGLQPGAFALDDASGLSPENLMSAETVVALLSFVVHQPWRDDFIGALATPQTGTLKTWPSLPPLRAKTGSIRHTVALAGYLEPGSSEPIVFVQFANHWTPARQNARVEFARRLREWGSP